MTGAGSLNDLPPTFTAQEAVKVGIARSTLRRWATSDGPVTELSRGVYRRSDAPESAHLALLAITKRAPMGVICLVSALDVHGLTDEVPAAVQLALPRTANIPTIDYPPIEAFRFDVATFDVGRSTFEAAPNERIPIYDPPRSVVDAMRLRFSIGDDIALQALRRYLTGPDSQPRRLIDYARQLGVEGPVTRAAEVVLS